MKTKFPLIPFAMLALLLIPLIGMQFSNEVKWSGYDFLVMGVLLLLTGTAIELIRRKNKNFRKRAIWIAVCLIIFLLIWAELAVGLFGTPFGGH